MSTENTQDTSAQSGVSTETANANTSTESTATAPATTLQQKIAEGSAKLDAAAATAAVVTPEQAAQAAVVPPAYAPNFKYRSAMQDKELDPFWQQFIKDADSEKKVKEIHTRAEAFDYMKEKFEGKTSDYESLNTDFETQARVVHKVQQSVKARDYDSVFRNVGIPEHEIIRWAARKVDQLQMVQQMTPEQRQVYERQQNAAIQNQQYEEQMTQMQNDLQTQASQSRELQLDVALTRQEVSPIVSFMDQKMGYNGAFRDLVVEEAKKSWAFDKVDLPIEKAIAIVVGKFGKMLDFKGAQNPQVQAPAQTQQASAQQVSPPAEKPVIPVIHGAAKTPVKKQVKSVADIRKRSKELEAEEASTAF